MVLAAVCRQLNEPSTDFGFRRRGWDNKRAALLAAAPAVSANQSWISGMRFGTKDWCHSSLIPKAEQYATVAAKSINLFVTVWEKQRHASTAITAYVQACKDLSWFEKSVIVGSLGWSESQ